MKITLPPHALVADKEHPQGWLELSVAAARALVHDLEDAIEQEEARRAPNIELGEAVAGSAPGGALRSFVRIYDPAGRDRFLLVETVGPAITPQEWRARGVAFE